MKAAVKFPTVPNTSSPASDIASTAAPVTFPNNASSRWATAFRLATVEATVAMRGRSTACRLEVTFFAALSMAVSKASKVFSTSPRTFCNAAAARKTGTSHSCARESRHQASYGGRWSQSKASFTHTHLQLGVQRCEGSVTGSKHPT